MLLLDRCCVCYRRHFECFVVTYQGHAVWIAGEESVCWETHVENWLPLSTVTHFAIREDVLSSLLPWKLRSDNTVISTCDVPVAPILLSLSGRGSNVCVVMCLGSFGLQTNLLHIFYCFSTSVFHHQPWPFSYFHFLYCSAELVCHIAQTLLFLWEVCCIRPPQSFSGKQDCDVGVFHRFILWVLQTW